LGADAAFHIQQHENGYDNDTVPMSGVFAESGYAEIGDGDQIMIIDECIPDMNWYGAGGSVNLTLYTTGYPGQTATTNGPFTFTSSTQIISPA